jgi:hypothetical protein
MDGDSRNFLEGCAGIRVIVLPSIHNSKIEGLNNTVAGIEIMVANISRKKESLPIIARKIVIATPGAVFTTLHFFVTNEWAQ